MKDSTKTVKFNVAVYLRLSKEDGDISENISKRVSNSISNQIRVIQDFLNKVPHVSIYDYYTDDGFSGVNFERPEFLRMKHDILDGKVNMVIVKDLSRFGREYIEVGRYIQKIFPSLGVRFVSVLDHFDSLTATSNDYHLLLPVKNFVNDNYCRDISQKVRSSQSAMRKSGLYVGSYVAYGYMKNPKNKNEIIIDESAAVIVRKIFNWKLDGINVYSIVDKLNQMGIPSPMEHKRLQGINFKTGFSRNAKPKWCDSTVYAILNNPIYTGTLEQGKKTKVNYKVKKVIDKPREEWDIYPNHHEAIISQEVFERVKELSKRDTRRSLKAEKVSPFSGFLYCNECKKPMIRRVYRYKGREMVSYICSTYNRQKGCSSHKIKEEELNVIVSSTIQQYMVAVCEIDKLIEANYSPPNHVSEHFLEFSSKINAKNIELERYSKMQSFLYRDLKEELITDEEYQDYTKFYENSIYKIKKEIKLIREEMQTHFENEKKAGTWIEEVKANRSVKTVSRIMLTSLVDKIIIKEQSKVKIVFQFEDFLIWLTLSCSEKGGV